VVQSAGATVRSTPEQVQVQVQVQSESVPEHSGTDRWAMALQFQNQSATGQQFQNQSATVSGSD
jgi:hypothetical protein